MSKATADLAKAICAYANCQAELHSQMRDCCTDPEQRKQGGRLSQVSQGTQALLGLAAVVGSAPHRHPAATGHSTFSLQKTR